MTSTSPPLQPRIVSLQGGFNCRDLGGHVGLNGRQTRRGMVFRSGHLGALTDADVAHLGALGVAQVCDFRGAQEWTQAPCALPGAAVYGLHVEPTMVVKLQAMRASGVDPTADDMAAVMARAYCDFALHNQAQFAALFSHLLDAPSATVFHCTAGKDRTGFAAALVLRTLGVSMEAVMADFLLSNRFFSAANLPQSLVGGGAGEAPSAFDPAAHTAPPQAALAVLHSVRAEFLLAAFTAIDEHSGSFDAYVSGALGLGPERLEALQAKLLEPA